MKVLVRIGYLEIEADGIPCGQGDMIEVREGKAKGFHSKPKWRRVPPCGNAKCACSTFVDEVSWTFGSGELYWCGSWEHPCKICAEDFQKKNPNEKVLV